MSETAAWTFVTPSLRQCPRSLVVDQVQHDLRIWEEWKTLGLLPCEGEMRDQPAWVVDVVQRAERTVASISAEQRARAEEQAKREADR